MRLAPKEMFPLWSVSGVDQRTPLPTLSPKSWSAKSPLIANCAPTRRPYDEVVRVPSAGAVARKRTPGAQLSTTSA
ncbi:MAG: hypothetical protein U0325_11025 [Polyangiales bacterium]